MCSWKLWKKCLLIPVGLTVLIRMSHVILRDDARREYLVFGPEDIANATEVPCEGIAHRFTFDRERLSTLAFVLTGIPESQTDLTTSRFSNRMCFCTKPRRKR